MPIAHCLLSEDLEFAPHPDQLVAAWAEKAEVSAEHMTLSLTPGSGLGGASYAVMATLYLPTLWARRDLERIELALASALAEGCRLDADRVHVITLSVQSGSVVEAGAVQRWEAVEPE